MPRSRNRRAAGAPRRAPGDPTDARRRALVLCTAALPLLVGGYLVALWASMPRTSGTTLRIDEFTRLVREGQVANATILNADRQIVGTYEEGRYIVSFGSDAVFSRLLDALEQANVATSVDQQSAKALLLPALYLLPALIVVDGMIIVFLLFAKAGDSLLGFGRSGARKVGSGDRKTTFADLAGVDEAIEELAEVRDYLARPERFRALGAAIPKGVLLTGPPGCGKTLLARALAGEADVPFFSMSGSEFVEMFAGVGASRIRHFFEVAQDAAPCIAFIDELDALGRARGQQASSDQEERESALNQLLVEMDGFDAQSGVVVLAATNRPDILDAALLRPGRFDRRVAVDRPDVRGRVAILAMHARGKPLSDDVDIDLVARRTVGFSGADLANVMNEAALLAARRGSAVIEPRHLSEAVERAVAGPERRSRVLSPDDRYRIAFHEAGHAVVSSALIKDETVAKVSIVARGHAGGLTWFVPEGDQLAATRTQLLDRLASMLAGRAGEEVVTGEVSTGAATDLDAAVTLARRMVAEFGMSEGLGAAAAAPVVPGGTGAYSEHLAARVDVEVEVLLRTAYERAVSTLHTHRRVLDEIAVALMEEETLEGEALERMITGLRTSSRPPTSDDRPVHARGGR